MGWLRDNVLRGWPVREVRQCGALPYRLDGRGRPELLLITARRGMRWLPPKGGPSWWRSDPGAAAQEAYEEAGVRGTVELRPCGSFLHRKHLTPQRLRICRIDLYLLKVDAMFDDWPERAERQRRWFTFEAAAAAVDNPSLRKLIEALDGRRFG